MIFADEDAATVCVFGDYPVGGADFPPRNFRNFAVFREVGAGKGVGGLDDCPDEERNGCQHDEKEKQGKLVVGEENGVLHSMISVGN